MTNPARVCLIAWRFLLALAALLALVVLSVAIYLVAQRLAAAHALRTTTSDLTAVGLLKPLDELSPPPSREAVANGEKLLAAIEGISALAKADPDITGGIDLMRFTSPGVATPTSIAPAPIFPPSKKASPPATWEELRTRLAPAQPIFTEARRILQSPTSYDYDLTSFKSQIPAEHPQELISWLRASALLHIHDGDLPAAIDDMQAIALGATFVGASPSLISYVLKLGLWMYGLSGLFWEILQNPGLSEADIVRLDHIARTNPTMPDAMRALEIELATTPYLLHKFKDMPLGELPWSFALPDNDLPLSDQITKIRAALWRHIWFDQDMALTLADGGKIIERGRELIAKGNWHATPDLAFPTMPRPGPWYLPLSSSTEANTLYRGIIKTAVRFETTHQLTLTAIALQRYHLRHGRYPDTLAALVPDYLPELPNDWYDGQPLKYHPRDTTYLLYSIGPDGIDQGGDPTPVEETAPRPTMTTGLDIVWPRREEPRP